LFELPNKIRLSQEQYFTVQGIYRGWALFGFVLLGAIGANLVHAILIRDEQRAFFDPTWADPPTDIALKVSKKFDLLGAFRRLMDHSSIGSASVPTRIRRRSALAASRITVTACVALLNAGKLTAASRNG
jgi:hypothetical protein